MPFVPDPTLKLRQLLSTHSGQEAPDKSGAQSRPLSSGLNYCTSSIAEETKIAHRKDRQTNLPVQETVGLKDQPQKHTVLN